MVNILNQILPEFHFSTHNTVIISGAGISADSGLPVGLGLTNRSLDFFNLTDHINSVFKQINQLYIKPITGGNEIGLYSYPRLEAVFNIFKDSFSTTSYENLVAHLLYADKSKLYSNLYHKLLAEHIHSGGSVITFNFDKLIENAYKDLFQSDLEDITIFPINSNLEADYTSRLIKVHGCMSNPKNIGVTLENISLAGFMGNEKKSLDDVLLRENVANLVFIGYSFSDTFDFIPYLSNINKKFNLFYFAYNPESNNEFKIISDLESINDSETYKYIMNTRINNIIDQKRIIFFTKKSFLHFYNDWQSKTAVHIDQKNKDNQINLDSVEYSYSMLRLYYEFGLSEHALFDKTTMNVHKKRVLFSLSFRSTYKMRFYVLSCLLNRDKHLYFLHTLLHVINLFCKLPDLLYNWAELHGTINEWIFVAWKFPKKYPIIRYPKAIITQFLGLSIIPSEFILLILLLIYKLFGYDKYCMKKRKIDYLLAKRQLYQPIYNWIKYLYFNKDFLAPRWFIMMLNTLMFSCMETVKQLNNLKQYRYIRKEYIFLPLWLNIRNTKDILFDFDDLILFNADSDYFIEVRNVSSIKKDFTKKITK